MKSSYRDYQNFIDRLRNYGSNDYEYIVVMEPQGKTITYNKTKKFGEHGLTDKRL